MAGQLVKTMRELIERKPMPGVYHLGFHDCSAFDHEVRFPRNVTGKQMICDRDALYGLVQI